MADHSFLRRSRPAANGIEACLENAVINIASMYWSIRSRVGELQDIAAKWSSLTADLISPLTAEASRDSLTVSACNTVVAAL